MNRAQVAADKRLREDLGIDSLSLIDVAVAAEDTFGIRIRGTAARPCQARSTRWVAAPRDRLSPHPIVTSRTRQRQRVAKSPAAPVRSGLSDHEN